METENKIRLTKATPMMLLPVIELDIPRMGWSAAGLSVTWKEGAASISIGKGKSKLSVWEVSSFRSLWARADFMQVIIYLSKEQETFSLQAGVISG